MNERKSMGELWVAGTALKGELGIKLKKNYTLESFTRVAYYKAKEKGENNTLPPI